MGRNCTDQWLMRMMRLNDIEINKNGGFSLWHIGEKQVKELA